MKVGCSESQGQPEGPGGAQEGMGAVTAEEGAVTASLAKD